MPQDVPMGQGYMGDALLAAFPGQYRASDPTPTNPVTYLPQPPGAISGRPSYTDPDAGRTLKLVTMPGVGQVVVPVDHTMVGQMNGPVVPVDYSMVGVDDIACSVEREDLSGLSGHHVCAWGVHKISKAAAAAAHEAVKLIRNGQIKTAGEAQAHIKAATAKVGNLVVSRLQARIPKVPGVVDQAASQAWNAIKPQVQQALGKVLGREAMGHYPGEDLSGMDAVIWRKKAVDHLSGAAGHAVQAVVAAIRSGKVTTAAQAHALIRQVIEQHAKQLASKASKFAAMKEQVIAEAWRAAAPQISALLGQKRPHPVMPPVAVPGGVRRVL